MVPGISTGIKKEEVWNLRKTNLATLLTEIEWCSKLYSFPGKKPSQYNI